MEYLIEPPVLSPSDPESSAGASADAVVPGGPVYKLPPWFQAWIDGLFHPTPTPVPTPVPPPTPFPPPGPQPTNVPLIDAFNMERFKRGLAPLKADQKLVDMANYWATWMAKNNLMTHLGFAQRMNAVYPNVAAGEIVAQGQQDVQSVVRAWMASPGHKANILGNFTKAGASVAYSKGGVAFWCGDFVG